MLVALVLTDAPANRADRRAMWAAIQQKYKVRRPTVLVVVLTWRFYSGLTWRTSRAREDLVR